LRFNREALFLFESMISAQTLRVCREGKPVPTFLDHALSTRRINRRELAPVQQQQVRTQSAASADPSPYRRRVGLQHKFGGSRLGIGPAAPVERSRGMKSQYRPARYADAIARHNAEHQRACGQAWPVDHDTIARGAHFLEHIEERTHLSARTGEDANLGLRRSQHETAQHGSEKNCFRLHDRQFTPAGHASVPRSAHGFRPVKRPICF